MRDPGNEVEFHKLKAKIYESNREANSDQSEVYKLKENGKISV